MKSQILTVAMVLIFGVTAQGEVRPVVVLDPGHGGIDVGVTGSYGAREKDVTLALALEVRRLMGLAYDVRLTRASDRGLFVTRRSELANSFHGDLLVSLHVGGGLSRDANRIALFVQRENQGRVVVRPGESSWDDGHHPYIQESQVLASFLKRSLSTLDGYGAVSFSGVPLRVARGAGMPVVLIEVGNLTNPREEGRLEDPGHLQKTASAVVAGLEAYLSR